MSSPQNKDWFKDVLAFHAKMGCYIGPRPEIPSDPAVIALRQKLIAEEFNEFSHALEAKNLPEVVDALVDLIYVALGTLVSFGVDPELIWEAVHSANMQKSRDTKRGDGKILKPANWVHPDVAFIIQTLSPLTVPEKEEYHG